MNISVGWLYRTYILSIIRRMDKDMKMKAFQEKASKFENVLQYMPPFKIYPDEIDKKKLNEKPPNGDSFQHSVEGMLYIACVLGLFPCKGLRDRNALALSYRRLSIPSFLSFFTIITLLWAAALSLAHTARSLTKATSGKSGGFANATAGGIFYMNAFVSSCIFRKIASNWPEAMVQWEKHEKDASPILKLRTRLRIIAYIILICALVEHLLSMAINTPHCRANLVRGNATLYSCLKEYCLRSHSFILNAVSYSTPLGIFIFLISKLATYVWNFQDLFLIELCIALKTQFKNINNKILQIDIATSNVKDWRYMRELYVSVSQLARDISILMGPLVLLSFTNNLYFICLQMLNGLGPSSQGPLHNAYFFGSFGFMVTRLICVALAASAVPSEARKALEFLRCCPSSTYCLEIQRLSFQITHDEIGFTGMGFFTINRNFMLGVAGAIATYEMVLLQFDMGQTPPPAADSFNE